MNQNITGSGFWRYGVVTASQQLLQPKVKKVKEILMCSEIGKPFSSNKIVELAQTHGVTFASNIRSKAMVLLHQTDPVFC